MKKYILILIICLVLITGCKKNEKGKLITLDYDELKEKIDNKDTFILVITRTDCSHCAIYIPRLEKVLKEYELTAYKVEVDTWKDEEKDDLGDICNVSGTPTTLFIENGEETNTSSRLVGEKTQDQIINRLKAMGYIKTENDEEDKEETKEENKEDTKESKKEE